jgi:starvation-inducible outer membrane lipoprotein
MKMIKNLMLCTLMLIASGCASPPVATHDPLLERVVTRSLGDSLVLKNPEAN